MRKWVAKHASAIVSLVGVLTLIPMVTTCRMFIGRPEVPNLIFMNFLRRQGTRRKNEKSLDAIQTSIEKRTWLVSPMITFSRNIFPRTY